MILTNKESVRPSENLNNHAEQNDVVTTQKMRIKSKNN